MSMSPVPVGPRHVGQEVELKERVASRPALTTKPFVTELPKEVEVKNSASLFHEKLNSIGNANAWSGRYAKTAIFGTVALLGLLGIAKAFSVGALAALISSNPLSLAIAALVLVILFSTYKARSTSNEQKQTRNDLEIHAKPLIKTMIEKFETAITNLNTGNELEDAGLKAKIQEVANRLKHMLSKLDLENEALQNLDKVDESNLETAIKTAFEHNVPKNFARYKR